MSVRVGRDRRWGAGTARGRRTGPRREGARREGARRGIAQDLGCLHHPRSDPIGSRRRLLDLSLKILGGLNHRSPRLVGRLFQLILRSGNLIDQRIGRARIGPRDLVRSRRRWWNTPRLTEPVHGRKGSLASRQREQDQRYRKCPSHIPFLGPWPDNFCAASA